MPGASQPTLFDDVAEKKVIFLIDTSGSMYCRLAIVKQHLKEFLLKMAFRGQLQILMHFDHLHGQLVVFDEMMKLCGHLGSTLYLVVPTVLSCL